MDATVPADFHAAAVLHSALKSFEALIAYPYHVQRTPATKWTELKDQLRNYGWGHGYAESLPNYGAYNGRLNLANPGDKIQTFTKLNNLVQKVQTVTLRLLSPVALRLAMDKMEELDYNEVEDIEAFIETQYDMIKRDIIILEDIGKTW